MANDASNDDLPVARQAFHSQPGHTVMKEETFMAWTNGRHGHQSLRRRAAFARASITAVSRRIDIPIYCDTCSLLSMQPYSDKEVWTLQQAAV